MYMYMIGGFNPSKKYWSIGMFIPNIWKKTNVPKHQSDIDCWILTLGWDDMGFHQWRSPQMVADVAGL